jgi:hypothetical protein
LVRLLSVRAPNTITAQIVGATSSIGTISNGYAKQNL